MRYWAVVAGAFLAFGSATSVAQVPENATLRRAVQAYDNLDFTQTINLARRALSQRMSAGEQARAYEVLGFAYAATDSQLKAVDAFKQTILLDPDRQLDPNRISPKITSLFFSALGQVLVVRQLEVDSARVVGDQGFVPIRFTVTEPARVRVRAVSGATTVPIDSTVETGTVNLRWPARLSNGDPLPAGEWVIVVQATAGPAEFSASQRVRVIHGSVDTLPHITSLPGYQSLPETEIPPRSSRPLGITLLYAGVVGAASLALESPSLESGSRTEIATIGAAALVAGVIMTIRRPAPRPAEANILYNKLLREQINQRNADLARQNAIRQQQVALTIVPLPKDAAPR